MLLGDISVALLVPVAVGIAIWVSWLVHPHSLPYGRLADAREQGLALTIVLLVGAIFALMYFDAPLWVVLLVAVAGVVLVAGGTSRPR